MKHLGDITKINGAEVEPVDIIVGGSPCQDLSVAGLRAGLAGARSGLFMEQIRIVKEMRENDRVKNGRTDATARPRYMVWENVPGAFSSNKGEDFRAVLEETAKIADENAVIPRLEKGQRWTSAGCVLGDGWSIAWRLHDAQFWGVPQRRKRIALVADFAGESAAEILFERESVSRDIEPGGKEGQEIAGAVEDGIRKAGEYADAYTLKVRGGVEIDSAGKRAGKGALIQTELSGTLGVSQDQTLICREPAICLNDQGGSQMDISEDVTGTLRAESHAHEPIVLGIDRAAFNQGQNAQYNFSIEEELAQTLVAKGAGAVMALTTEMTPKIDEEGVAFSLRSRDYKDAQCVMMCKPIYTHPQNSTWTYEEKEQVQTLAASMGTGGGNVPLVQVNDVYGLDMCGGKGVVYYDKNISPTHGADGHANAVVYDGNRRHDYKPFDGVCETIQAHYGTGGGNVPMVVEPESKAVESHAQDARYNIGTINQTVSSNMEHDAANGGLVLESIDNYVVRKLTPLECERLQGFPDGWTDIGDWVDSKGKKHKGEADAPRYKALGNSIALPFWQWMAERMVAVLKADGVERSTMASLFDGIGGFPLVYSRWGCEPVWASEIEEFPIAVTKRRFPDD